MNLPVSAHTVASFKVSGGGFPIVIEADPGAYGDIDAHLLISPVGTWDKITVDVGAHRLGSVKPFEVAAGVLQFSGSNTASLPRIPVYSRPVFTVLFAFDGDTGDVITDSVEVTYDGVANRVALSAKNVYAAVAYTAYTSRVQELIYSPKTEKTPTSQAGLFGTKTTFGVIAAFRKTPPALTVYQPPLFTLDSGNSEVELYRIISYVITTPDGEFEMPPGYPTSGDYPGGLPRLDLSTHMRTERVHEIGMMDSNGRGWTKEFHRTNLAPYVGSFNYKPVKKLQESTVPEGKFGKDLVLKAKNIVAARGLGKI